MDFGAEMVKGLESVTKKWTKQRKAEEREASRRSRRYDVLVPTYRETLKDVAWEVMEEAYLKASSGNSLPALARQIMYAARGEIQERTGKPLNDQYFTQTLLPDYLKEHPDKAAEWDVVFDARGHFEEPHTRCIVPLGTMDVREYLYGVRNHVVGDEPKVSLGSADCFPTKGSEHRFGAVLFIEKEGFLPLFRAVKLAERYDLAIMSTKGMSVTASRQLVDRLCSERDGIPLLVLHDFDKAGFSIVSTLQRDTRRYEFENSVHVIDLGLRLKDVQAYDLESEDVHYGKSDPTWNLMKNGATDEEIAFLHDEESSSWGHHRGKRVELNAFTSGDLIKYIEKKLREHKVKKVVPDRECLKTAYKRALEIEELHRELERIRPKVSKRVKATKVPRGLAREVGERLKKKPELSWDESLAQVVRADMKRRR